MLIATPFLNDIFCGGIDIDGQKNPSVNDMAYDLLQILAVSQSKVTNSTQVDIYNNIIHLINNPDISSHINEEIKENFANLAMSSRGTILATTAMKAQCKKSKKNALTLLNNNSNEEREEEKVIDTSEKEVELTDGEQKALAKFGGELSPEEFKDNLQGLLDEVQKAEEEQRVQTASAPVKASAPKINKPFQGNADLLRSALADIFDGVGNLSTESYDEHTIQDKMDIAYNRCISNSYSYTGNNTDNVQSYMNIASEFAGSSNKFKAELYDRLQRTFEYVQSYDLSAHGLNADYAKLRQSQIIPNYILKERGYLLDASACSTGKSGTITLAPIETGAKTSVVVVENNTYTDMLKTFKSWYSTKPEFRIVDKDEFFSEDWMNTDQKVICILAKSTLAISSDAYMVKKGQKSFVDFISKTKVDLLICDEAHNFKGSNEGGTHSHKSEDESKEEDSHNNCSRAVFTMSQMADYRLFSTATPFLNNYVEIAKILQMLLPTDEADKNHRHQENIRFIEDETKCAQHIMKKVASLYTPLHCIINRVPKPEVEYTTVEVTNKGKKFVNNSVETVDGAWMDFWTDRYRAAVKHEEESSKGAGNGQKNWHDISQDDLFFEDYLLLMREEIVSELKQGNQLCFYTNIAKTKHKEIKEMILEIANESGVALADKEVFIANGDTSSDLRKATKIKVDSGKEVVKTRLAETVWHKDCRVLIANNVIAVGMDGLQGTDQIKDCGRISRIFMLANPYHDAFLYQLYSRFVRTQGCSGTELPECTFYRPMIWWDAAVPGQDSIKYCRNDQTNKRLLLKKIKSDLVVDGKFPDGIDIESLNNELSDTIIAQLGNNLFGTEEGKKELKEVSQKFINKKGGN